MLLATVIASCTGTQRDALVSIFAAAGGPSWTTKAGWNTSDPICTWAGVNCEAGLVVGLRLVGFGLTGVLSPDVQCLPFLKSLYLNNNTLTTLLPDAVCSLANLQYFQADSAAQSGTIPACVCTMVNLMYFYMDNDGVSGQIPSCVNQMAALKEFHADCNQLTGAVPEGFGSLSFVTEIRFDCNSGLTCTPITRDAFIYNCDPLACVGCSIISTGQPPVDGGDVCSDWK